MDTHYGTCPLGRYHGYQCPARVHVHALPSKKYKRVTSMPLYVSREWAVISEFSLLCPLSLPFLNHLGILTPTPATIVGSFVPHCPTSIIELATSANAALCNWLDSCAEGTYPRPNIVICDFYSIPDIIARVVKMNYLGEEGEWTVM